MDKQQVVDRIFNAYALVMNQGYVPEIMLLPFECYETIEEDCKKNLFPSPILFAGAHIEKIKIMYKESCAMYPDLYKIFEEE